MSFQVKQNILRWPRQILPLPTQCHCPPNTLVHPLNQRNHYMHCSNYGLVSFNEHMWNSIILAPGYWNGGLQPGPGPHINLPRALPGSQTSHTLLNEIPWFLPLFLVFCTTKLAQLRQSQHTAPCWLSPGKNEQISIKLPSGPLLKIKTLLLKMAKCSPLEQQKPHQTKPNVLQQRISMAVLLP